MLYHDGFLVLNIFFVNAYEMYIIIMCTYFIFTRPAVDNSLATICYLFPFFIV